jgi:hypothetical protein
MEPVSEKFHNLFEQKWEMRKRAISSERYEHEIRKIIVDILGGPKKDDLLDELLGKIDTAISEDDLTVCAYKYMHIERKSDDYIPESILDTVQVKGIDPWRPQIHTLFRKTDILDRILEALGANFGHQMRSRIVEENNTYIMYEESIMINYSPRFSRFINDDDL